MNLDHINISAPYPLLLELKAFYINILELEEGDRPAFSKRGFWLYSDKQAVMHLFESDSHFPYEKQGYLDHVAFSHSGIERFLKNLKDSGIQYTTSGVSSLDLTQVFLHDPAGIKLEINFYGEQPLS